MSTDASIFVILSVLILKITLYLINYCICKAPSTLMANISKHQFLEPSGMGVNTTQKRNDVLT